VTGDHRRRASSTRLNRGERSGRRG
jgi:hypothetical protein